MVFPYYPLYCIYHVYIHIYIYIHTCMHTYIYIYIYRWYKLRSEQDTGTWPGQGWFVRNLQPDKSSRGLGSMSPYSAQISISFIAYIFLFFHSSVGLVGNFAGLLPCRCTVPSAIVHCFQNEAGHQTVKAPSMPCCGATGPCKHSLAFMSQDWWNWQINWMKSVSMESYQYRNQVNGEFFCIPVSTFTVFQTRI